MATVSKWTPFGVALDIAASSAGVTRTSATQYKVTINASWETYYSGAKTNYGMTASSGGSSATINAFGTKSAGGSGSFTGTYSISGNGSATKTVTVTFRNFNNDNGDSATKTVSFSVSVPAWTSYTVTYNANGGSGAPSSQTKWKDQTLQLSGTRPSRSGYTFAGWGTSATDTTVDYAASANYTANAGITLYAIWKKTITLTYSANGGSNAPSATSATIYNATTSYKFTLSSATPTRSGYTFLGWSTSSTATTASYSAGGNITLSANDTLYAVWKVAYVAPKITGYSVKRCGPDGTVSDSATSALVSFSWSTFSATPTITIHWESSDGDIATSTTVDVSGTSGTVSQVIGYGMLDTGISFTVRTTVYDGQETAAKSADIYSLEFPMEVVRDNGKYGIAFGKTAEDVGYADFAYDIKSRGRMSFANNKTIHGTDPTDGTMTKEAFNPCNANGNIVVGYGAYSAKNGDTNIYGNDVHIGVANLASPGTFKPYRSRGDAITITYRSAGYVTNSGKDVSFWIPLSAPIVGSPTLTASSVDGFVLRQGNNYTHGSTASVSVSPASYEVTGTPFSGIYVKAVFSNTTNVTNNDAIGIYWSGKIELT